MPGRKAFAARVSRQAGRRTAAGPEGNGAEHHSWTRNLEEEGQETVAGHVVVRAAPNATAVAAEGRRRAVAGEVGMGSLGAAVVHMSVGHIRRNRNGTMSGIRHDPSHHGLCHYTRRAGEQAAVAAAAAGRETGHMFRGIQQGGCSGARAPAAGEAGRNCMPFYLMLHGGETYMVKYRPHQVYLLCCSLGNRVFAPRVQVVEG